ncbi:zinc-binding dehydrogenase [Peribacillus aracenensis]|uniref:zinc-binding dehydrogenase n=1 Tax=Peribacillus aracenensis TaxID=2976708 RepID=UPI0021A50AE3|nr:zinc-binding dehydrogenase [Peribacillus sp. BBB004]
MERGGGVNGGDFVLISGPGTIGLLALQVVKANGGNCIVIGTSHDKERLNLTLEMGAMAVIDVEEENSEERLMELTKQQGFDVAIECAGVSISYYASKVCSFKWGCLERKLNSIPIFL